MFICVLFYHECRKNMAFQSMLLVKYDVLFMCYSCNIWPSVRKNKNYKSNWRNPLSRINLKLHYFTINKSCLLVNNKKILEVRFRKADSLKKYKCSINEV